MSPTSTIFVPLACERRRLVAVEEAHFGVRPDEEPEVDAPAEGVLGIDAAETPPGATTLLPKSTPSEKTQPKVTPTSAFCAKAGMAASITMSCHQTIRLNIGRIPFDERVFVDWLCS